MDNALPLESSIGINLEQSPMSDSVKKTMSRWQAFGIHFCISAAIFIFLAYLVLYHWYADFFFATDGGWEGMRIIVGVDLVLGPLLTLIVFKAGKKGMRNDLIMIGIFQAICLSAGVYVVYDERPIALVYVDGQFNSMASDSYRSAQLAVPDLSGFAGPGPKRLQVNVPDVDGHSAIRSEFFRSRKHMSLAADHYAPFDSHNANFLAEAYNLDEILDRDQESQALPEFLAKHGGVPIDYRFYPLATRFSYHFLGFRRSDNALVGLLRTPGPM